MATPGLTIGPLSVDSGGELVGKVGTQNVADRMLKRHAALYPIALVKALSLPLDVGRSATLDMEEVEKALRSLTGRQAFLAPDDKLEDAGVRGPDSYGNRVVSVVFTKPSGRSARGAIPYEDMKASQRAYDRAVAEEAGQDVGPADTDAAVTAAEAEAADAKAQLAAVQERLAALENPEPFEGYEDADWRDIVKRVEADGVTEFGTTGLQRMRDYETRRENPRVSILNAIDEALAGT